jgi:hypothetical protein
MNAVFTLLMGCISQEETYPHQDAPRCNPSHSRSTSKERRGRDAGVRPQRICQGKAGYLDDRDVSKTELREQLP